eukprot:TRINITY_DN109835_c0_g1_i1.p1 TRINITY_DN109835_c0_g1~~TRINITY_DN109835_c0_g1_i1.p1  ORF type:complete len:425 (-),score=43.30 TRINITY_DN109835_c0_g1_i1:548-1633(-)
MSSGFFSFSDNSAVALFYSALYAREFAWDPQVHHEHALVLDTMAYLRASPKHSIVRLAAKPASDLHDSDYNSQHWLHGLQQADPKVFSQEEQSELTQQLRASAVTSSFGIWLLDSTYLPKVSCSGEQIVTMRNIFNLPPGWELPSPEPYKSYGQILQLIMGTVSVNEEDQLVEDVTQDDRLPLLSFFDVNPAGSAALGFPMAACIQDVLPLWAQALLKQLSKRLKGGRTFSFRYIPRPRIPDLECGTEKIPFHVMLRRLKQWLTTQKTWPKTATRGIKRNSQELRLAKWIEKQRLFFKTGVLSQERKQGLEAIPDWQWQVRKSSRRPGLRNSAPSKQVESATTSSCHVQRGRKRKRFKSAG